MPRPQKRSTAARPAGVALALHDASLRAELLLRERARLLRDIEKKRAQLERAQAKAAGEAEATLKRMAPLMARHDALLRSLTSLFEELLAPGRLPKRARAQILRLRRMLEFEGLLDAIDDEPLDPERDESPWRDEHEAPHHHHGQEQARNHGHWSAGSPEEVASAGQRGQERRSVRELFRSLARALHPDRARHEDDRLRRTEVMKQVTRAYQEGDLARLIELEAAWQTEASSAADDAVARCRELERVNRELLDQVRELTRQIRDVKHGAREASLGLSPDELIEQAGQELDELEELVDFVTSFKNGKITLSELLRGPLSARSAEEAELLDLLFGDAPQPRRSRARKRRR